MYKVLIIDDEPIIRKGLKNIINWKQFDCEICGEACDGVEGMQCIRDQLPDIIITDIKMPEVDGLTMIKEIKNIVPDCKMVILTGYRDFEYAQEAVKLGAFDFVLKPTKIEEMTTILQRAVKELKFLKQKEEEMNQLKMHFEQNIPVLREKLLNDIIFRINTNEQEILEKLELYHMCIDEFTLLTVENDEEELNSKLNQYDKHLYQFGIINIFEETFSDAFHVSNISLNNKQVAFILQPLHGHKIEVSIIEEKAGQLQEIIRSCFDFTVTVAISSAGTGALALPDKLKECMEALEYKFYLGSDSVIFYHDLKTFYKINDDNLLDDLRKSLTDAIKTGNDNQVQKRLREIYERINGKGLLDKKTIKRFYWTILNDVNHIRTVMLSDDHDKPAGSIDVGSLYHMIEECESIEDLNALLGGVARQITEKINHFNNRSIKLVLQKAIDYLQQHYHEPVTLNDVAKHVYVSTYYISRMFTKQLGKNFVDCLNEIRIEKAKELLKDAQYKTYEIAEMVGIPDAHYFSRQFKKYTGMTPTEYRAQ